MPKLDLTEYQEAPKVSIIASKWLVDVRNELGNPPTPFSDSGEKLMKVIIAVWEDLYPVQVKDWFAMRANYQKNELSISTQVSRKTGRSLASYPLPVFKMMKKLFPDFKIGERKNTIKLIRKFPIFRMANKI